MLLPITKRQAMKYFRIYSCIIAVIIISILIFLAGFCKEDYPALYRYISPH